MLGLPKSIVKLVPYQNIWKICFEFEKSFFNSRINDKVIEIQHIGSTSVPDLVSKPIIDILIGLDSLKSFSDILSDLEHLEYEYRVENGDENRRVLGKGNPRLFHLHVVKFNSDDWISHLIFRDTLRNDDIIRVEYQRLKLKLATKYPNDRKGYTNGKAAFIESLLRKE